MIRKFVGGLLTFVIVGACLKLGANIVDLWWGVSCAI